MKKYEHLFHQIDGKHENLGGASGVIVIVVGNGHGDTSSNPAWDGLHFT